MDLTQQLFVFLKSLPTVSYRVYTGKIGRLLVVSRTLQGPLLTQTSRNEVPRL